MTMMPVNSEKCPFHIGQEVNNVIEVCKRTHRNRLAVEITDLVKNVIIQVETLTYRERKTEAIRIAAAREAAGIGLGENDLRIRNFYDDCVLTLERDPKEGLLGPYRIVKIETDNVNA